MLYRSAQPDEGGLKSAKALGIVTVINLRAFHNDRQQASENGLLDEELSVKTWRIEDEDVVRVMNLPRQAGRARPTWCTASTAPTAPA